MVRVAWESRCVFVTWKPEEGKRREVWEGWFQMSNRARFGNGGQGSLDTQGCDELWTFLQLAAA
jgi:hypothetical protein